MVWQDHSIQQCYQRRNEFQLSNSAKYYLDGLDRLCAADYIPSVTDILHLDFPTVGIAEYMFPHGILRFNV